MDWDILRYFDPEDEYFVRLRSLPHWSQAGAITFAAFRLGDAIPKSVRLQCLGLIQKIYSRFGIRTSLDQLSPCLDHIQPEVRLEIRRRVDAVWNRVLDQGYGSCLLGKPHLAEVVSESLHHCDGVEYRITDFVVMPNHVHLLAAFATHESMLKSLANRKRYSAVQINQQIGRLGRLWQPDGFDHLVRSENALRRYRKYIAANPRRAGLSPKEYIHYSRELPGLGCEKVR